MSRRRRQPTACTRCGQRLPHASVVAFWRNPSNGWHAMERFCGCAEVRMVAQIVMDPALALSLPSTPLAEPPSLRQLGQGLRRAPRGAAGTLDPAGRRETSMPVTGAGAEVWCDGTGEKYVWLAVAGQLALCEVEYDA